MSEKSEVRVERGPVAQDEPFALGMAKLLEREGKTVAAAELRRLSIENERIGPLAERVLELKAQRDALLEALRWIDNVNAMDYEYQKVARAAIKAVEEGK